MPSTILCLSSWNDPAPRLTRPERTPSRLPREPGLVASRLPCQKSLHTMTPRLGRTSCASRDGFSHVNGMANRTAERSSNDMRRMCEQWLEGARGSRWHKPRTPQKRKLEPGCDDNATDPHDDASDFQRRDDRATTLTKEVHFSKGCSALLDDPPAAKESPWRCETQLTLHRSLAAAPSLTLVQDALLSFAPDSAAHNTSQATSSQVTETSLTALRMKDGSHPLVAVGETTSHSESPACYCFRGHDTVPPTNTTGVRSFTPSDVGSRNTTESENDMPRDHGFGERVQANLPVLLSSGNRTSSGQVLPLVLLER